MKTIPRSWLAALPLMAAGASHAADAPIQLLNAIAPGQRVADAQVTLQKPGAASRSTRSNAQGIASLDISDLASSSTVLIVQKVGYVELVAHCPCAGLSYALEPANIIDTSNDTMRILLTWGYRRHGFDAHLVYPKNHVYDGEPRGDDAFFTSTDEGGGSQAVTSQSIIISQRHAGEPYVFAVHDYWTSTEPGASDLGASAARVTVYQGDKPVRSYTVPRGKGNVWTVFQITETGAIRDLNTLSSSFVPRDKVMDGTRHAVMAMTGLGDTLGNDADATLVNQWGEQAYRDGRYDDAMLMFGRAVRWRPDDGQLYGNLAMAYQKAGDPEVAAWANRKAIALATGRDGAELRASSHYNLGRLGEEAGHRDDALSHYRAAQRENPKPVYQNAIRRLGGGG